MQAVVDELNSDKHIIEMEKDLLIKEELKAAHDMAVALEQRRVDQLKAKSQQIKRVLDRDNAIMRKKREEFHRQETALEERKRRAEEQKMEFLAHKAWQQEQHRLRIEQAVKNNARREEERIARIMEKRRARDEHLAKTQKEKERQQKEALKARKRKNNHRQKVLNDAYTIMENRAMEFNERMKEKEELMLYLQAKAKADRDKAAEEREFKVAEQEEKAERIRQRLLAKKLKDQE